MTSNLLDRLYDWGWQTAFTIGAAAFGWFLYIDRKVGWIDRRHAASIAALHLIVASDYVKKTDMAALEQRIASEFQGMKDEIKQGNSLILDVLMQRKSRGR